MTIRSFHTKLTRLLESNRHIAIIWGIEDIQNVRSDLSDHQAWHVLQECERRYDCEFGINWEFFDRIADDLYPRPE